MSTSLGGKVALVTGAGSADEPDPSARNRGRTTKMTKTWMITGSSRGFGHRLAEAVLDSGDNLVATARSTGSLKDLAETYGDRVRTVALDVTDPAAAKAAVDTAVREFGRLDVLVNNAGYANVAPIEDADPDDFRAQVETNLWGVINVTRAALPVLHAQHSGHVIQFSSIGGRLGTPGLGAYQLSKWGVEGFSEVLAQEVAPLGVKVTIIEPGGFRTDWAGSSMKAGENLHPDYQPTVGTVIEGLRGSSGKQEGDPARAAKIIVDIAGSAEPPLRLLLGKGALRLARDITARRSAEDEAWAAVTESADFGDTK
jgi:NAD(P)-dependent dehydrogenase (short-subunit alcohol dehydrogenase family)